LASSLLKPLRRGIAAALILYTSIGAANDWSASLEGGPTWLRYKEFDTDGSRLVTESGVVPELAGSLMWRHADFGASLEGRWASARIDYDGQTQTGRGFTTDTDLEVGRLILRGHWQAEPVLALHTGLRQEWRNRSINGHSGVSGLDEHYQTLAWLAGISWTPDFAWRPRLRFEYYQSLSSRQTINFQGLYDDATLHPGTTNGANLRLELPLSAVSERLALVAMTEFARTQRSNPAPIYRYGFLAGSATQPRTDFVSASIAIQGRW